MLLNLCTERFYKIKLLATINESLFHAVVVFITMNYKREVKVVIKRLIKRTKDLIYDLSKKNKSKSKVYNIDGRGNNLYQEQIYARMINVWIYKSVIGPVVILLSDVWILEQFLGKKMTIDQTKNLKKTSSQSLTKVLDGM